MRKYTLTILDVTGIQSYIFGSNRLPENIGASQLVHEATTIWIRDCLPVGQHNLGADAEVTLDAQRTLEQDATLEAEVILRGGGNVLILFRSLDQAREAVRKLTQRLLEQAPGLELAVAHHEFDWDHKEIGGSKGVHKHLYQALNERKQQRTRSASLLGLGVTLECRSTGFPAVQMTKSKGADDPARPVSAEIYAKLRKPLQDAAYKRLKHLLPQVEAENYQLTRDFGNLGGTEGDVNYIAVVHADGNGMGQRFKNVTEAYISVDQNRACLNALRTLSEAVDQAGRLAIQGMIDHMVAAFKLALPDSSLATFLNGLPRDPETKRQILPFRPIVYGGDDVTFVCDGRLGLALAAAYLEAWEHVTANDATLVQAYACAGVAVVKTHYPFVRAYELAGDLCDKAKQAVRKSNHLMSALDWHFAMSGIGGTLDQIRHREYRSVEGNSMHLRPVSLKLGQLGPSWYGWSAFDQVVRAFQRDPLWRERRNKVKQLREVLREGPELVGRFRRESNLSDLPMLSNESNELQTKGWDGPFCGYFDAIEALDFYLPLDKEAK